MPAFHVLDKTADAPFLRAGVSDPLTRVAFRPTNRVARCATCGLVSLRETWEAVGGCPNGHPTATATWDPRAALVAPSVGDGAAGLPPPAGPPAAPPPPGRPAWLLPAAVVAVLALVVTGLWLGGVFSRDDAPPVADTPVVAPTGPSAVDVEAGETEGRLDAPDFRGSDGRYQDLYSFAADSSGRLLTVAVVSSAFAPELSVETPSGERVRAEVLPAQTLADGSLSPERRVTVRDLTGPGLYLITVTSREPGASGAYTLRVRQDEAVRTLTPGAAATPGELLRSSRIVDGYYRDTYRFTGAAGREHTIRVGSSAFAPTVVVTSPGGATVRGETGRAGGSLTFTFTPEAGGAYTAVVSSREREKTGAYTVGLTVAPAPRVPTPEAAPAGASLRPDGSPTRDSLGVGQSRTYAVNGRVGDRVTVEIRAEGFTPSLTLIGPRGVVERAAPDGDRARVRATLSSAGRYRVEIGGSGAGRYTVTLDQQAAPTSDRIPRLPGQEPIQSEIEPAPPPAPDGSYRPQPIQP